MLELAPLVFRVAAIVVAAILVTWGGSADPAVPQDWSEFGARPGRFGLGLRLNPRSGGSACERCGASPRKRSSLALVPISRTFGKRPIMSSLVGWTTILRTLRRKYFVSMDFSADHGDGEQSAQTGRAGSGRQLDNHTTSS